jgi:hypothetical protein
MIQSIIPEPLSTILSTYCDVNAIEMVDYLHDDIKDHKIAPDKAKLFREQLLDAIENKTITPDQYKALTGENEYTTQEDLQDWLAELWSIVFPDQKLNSTTAR